MKIIKRIGVFETNSSSTHSFSIVENKGIDKNTYTVQIVSAEEKIIWLLCMIDNAEGHFNSSYAKERQTILEWEKERVLDDIKRGLYTLEEFGYDSIEDYLENFVDYKTQSRDEVLNFKEAVMFFYCKKNNITRQQLDELLQEKVQKIPENSGKCRHYTRDGKPREKEGYSQFYCLRYFDEGALDDCGCGFENYDEMSDNLSLSENKEKMQEYIEWFLSDKCKIVARERYGY